MPLTNTFCMPPKCIYAHTHKVFMMQSHIQVYKSHANIYGPLWTPSSICIVWTHFSQYSLCLSSLSFPQKTLSFHTSIIDNHMTDFFYHHSIMYVLTPLYSPICSTFSCYLYCQFTCINQVDTMLYLTLIWVLFSLGQHLYKSLETSSIAAYQAFGLYCQQLLSITIKSIYCTLYLCFFHTGFTIFTQRILPLMLSFDFVPLDPLAPKLMT